MSVFSDPVDPAAKSLFERLLEYLAMAMMATLAGLVFANAMSRYAFNAPLAWSEEVVTTLLIWVAAVGILLAGKRGALITCDILTARVPPATQNLMRIGCGVIGALVMFRCAWLSWKYMDVFGADRSPMLGWPKGAVILPLVISMAGIGILLLWALLPKRGTR